MLSEDVDHSAGITHFFWQHDNSDFFYKRNYIEYYLNGFFIRDCGKLQNQCEVFHEKRFELMRLTHML